MNEQFTFESESFENYPGFGELDEYEAEQALFDLESDGEAEGYFEFEEAEEEGEEEGEEEEGPFEAEMYEMYETARRPGAPAGQKVQQLRVAHANMKKAVEAMGRHVTQRNGVYHFTLPARSAQDAAARLRINPQSLGHLLNSMKHRNMMLARLRKSGASEMEMDAEAASCPGVTGVRTRWWGIKILLNECHTRALINALRAGSGVGALCARIAPAPQVKAVCRILGALGRIGAAAINAIDNLGGKKGIVITKLWFPPISPPVVWHQ